MKSQMTQKQMLELEMQKLCGLKWSEIQQPRGSDARVARRVLAWAYVEVLGQEVSRVAEDLKILHPCSVLRILRRKALSADEYDLRRKLLRRIQEGQVRVEVEAQAG